MVPGSRKLALLMQAYAGPLDVRAGASEPAIPETCFLIDAVAAAALPSARADEVQALPWWRFRARALWVLDLFERLERQERQSQALRHRAAASWTETELRLSRSEA